MDPSAAAAAMHYSRMEEERKEERKEGRGIWVKVGQILRRQAGRQVGKQGQNPELIMKRRERPVLDRERRLAKVQCTGWLG